MTYREGVGDSTPHVVGMTRYNNTEPFRLPDEQEAYALDGVWLL